MKSPSTPKSMAPSGRFPITIKRGSVTATIYEMSRKYKRKKRGPDGIPVIIEEDRIVYPLAYTGPDGRWLVRQFGKLERAKEEGRLAVDQIVAGEAHGAMVTKADRSLLQAIRDITAPLSPIDALNEWKAAREMVGTEVMQAVRAWKRRQTKVKQMPVDQVIVEFLAQKADEGVGIETYKNALKHFKAKFGHRFIDEIHTKELTAWLKGTKNHSTRNTHRKRIVTMFGWARAQEYLPRDMTTEAELTKAAQETAPARAIIAPEVFVALLDGSLRDRPDYIPALVVTGFMGLRSEEAFKQKWEDIDMDEGHLSVSVAKLGTAADRYVPMPECAKHWLRFTPAAERKGIIHPFDTEVITLVRNFARDNLKLKLPKNCFRKSWISYRLALTKDLTATSMEAGHSTQVEIRNYRGKAKEPAAKEWFSILPIALRNLQFVTSPKVTKKVNQMCLVGLACLYPKWIHDELLLFCSKPPGVRLKELNERAELPDIFKDAHRHQSHIEKTGQNSDAAKHAEYVPKLRLVK